MKIGNTKIYWRRFLWITMFGEKVIAVSLTVEWKTKKGFTKRVNNIIWHIKL